ncbi:hypothetical protein HQ545_05500 [Candidatus Woesearchaeota archaeon]|nr:hypothetical protein [Candidatus Woesearchaeota archaeon]
MPKSLRNRLLEKGWTQEEIEQTMGLLYSNDKIEKHQGFANANHPIIYWVGLVVAIIGNFLLAVTLIPFLMFLNSVQVYVILGVVGFVFGALFSVILKEIESVDQTHHILAGVFIPVLALITVYIMVTVANRFNAVINNPNPQNAIMISLVYLITFSAPYFVYKIKDIHWHRKHQIPPETA